MPSVRLEDLTKIFQRHQDYEFLIRLLKRGQLSYLDEELTIKHEYDSPTAEKVALGKKKFFENSGMILIKPSKTDMTCMRHICGN